MSDTEVGRIYTVLGFKVDQQELSEVHQFINGISQTIKSLIESTGDLANSLTRLSKSTNLSPQLIQQFELLGEKAGIGATAVDSILRSMRGLTRDTNFGMTSEIASWGVYLQQGESAVSALQKILAQASRLSADQRDELFSVAGIPIEEGWMLMEEMQRNGFNISDVIGMSDADIEKMNSVNSILREMNFSVGRFISKLVGQQSDTILWGAERVKNALGEVFSVVEQVFGYGLVQDFVSALIVSAPLISTVADKMTMAGKAISFLGSSFKWIAMTLGSLVALDSIFNFTGLNLKLGDFDAIFGGISKQISDSFGIDLTAGWNSALDFLIASLESLSSVAGGGGKILGRIADSLIPFLEKVKTEGFFTAISEPLNNFIKGVKDFVKNAIDEMMPRIEAFFKNIVTPIIDSIVMKLRMLFIEVWEEIKNDLRKTTAGSYMFGDPLSERELEEEKIIRKKMIERNYNAKYGAKKPSNEDVIALREQNDKIFSEALTRRLNEPTEVKNVVLPTNNSVGVFDEMFSKVASFSKPNTKNIENNLANNNKNVAVTTNQNITVTPDNLNKVKERLGDTTESVLERLGLDTSTAMNQGLGSNFNATQNISGNY